MTSNFRTCAYHERTFNYGDPVILGTVVGPANVPDDKTEVNQYYFCDIDCAYHHVREWINKNYNISLRWYVIPDGVRLLQEALDNEVKFSERKEASP